MAAIAPKAAAAALAGNSWHVSPTGSGNTCTDAARCALPFAIDGTKSPARPGDVIWLHGGTYLGNFVSSLNGTATQGIQVVAWPGEKPILDGYSPTTLMAAIGTADSSLTLAAGLYTQGSVINIDSENIYLWGSGPTGGKYTGIERGWNATVKAAHAVGAPVFAPGAATLVIGGTYTTFGPGIEITSSYPLRVYPMAGSNPTMRGPGGVTFSGDHPSFIGNYVHDVTDGISNSTGTEGTNITVADNVCYAVGWWAPDGGHGHCVYWHNKSTAGPLLELAGIELTSAAENSQAYNNGQPIANITRDGIISAMAGTLFNPTGGTYNIVIGTPDVVFDHPVLINSCAYQKTTGTGISFGYAAGTINGVLTGDYSASPYSAISLPGVTTGLVATGDTAVGPNITLPKAGNTIMGWPGSGSPPAPAPPQQICTIPSLYEPVRAHIAVYNWALLPTVALDFSTFLSPGDSYVLLNAFDFAGAPVKVGTYDGTPVSVPTSGLHVASPVGIAAPAETGPLFNAFVVRKTGGAPSPTPSATPSATAVATATPTTTPTSPPPPTSTLTPSPTSSPTATASLPSPRPPTATVTPVPPTATAAPPTATAVPPSPTPTPTSTKPPPSATPTRTATSTRTPTKTPTPNIATRICNLEKAVGVGPCAVPTP